MKAPRFRWFRAARDRTGVRPGRRRPSRFRPRARHVRRAGPRPRRAPADRRSRGRRPAHPGEAAAVAPVRPAGRAVIGDLLEHQASSAVGGVRDVDPAGSLHPLPAEDGRPEPGGDVGVRAVHDDVHQLADRGVHPGECSRSPAGSRVSRAVTGPIHNRVWSPASPALLGFKPRRSDHVLSSRRTLTASPSSTPLPPKQPGGQSRFTAGGGDAFEGMVKIACCRGT